MLNLKLPTDPNWITIAEKNISEILSDHAWCEQKAASNSISLIVSYPEYPDMVDTLLSIAREELVHFEMVHRKIKQRGFKLGHERKDEYVNELLRFIRKGMGREKALTDRLLFAALVEARSCERFKLLSEQINDADLRAFYRELMVSEANHYGTFLGFARKYAGPEKTEWRWKEWLEYEAGVVVRYGKKETIHG